jgi:hypothetical protein
MSGGLTLNEVLELVQNEEDDVSEVESEDDELSGADILGNDSRSALLADDGLRTLGCGEHDLLYIDTREDPCYRSSLLLLDPSLVEVMLQKAASCSLKFIDVL